MLLAHNEHCCAIGSICTAASYKAVLLSYCFYNATQQRPRLLLWFNLYRSMDKKPHAQWYALDEITYPFPNFKGATVEV